MTERRLQRLLIHGDDDVDTHMSPMRGESYPLQNWTRAANVNDNLKQSHLKDESMSSLKSPRLQASNTSSPHRAIFGAGYISPTDSGATAVMLRTKQQTLERQRNEASWAVHDPPILLCTSSSILGSRKPSEWERPTRQGVHNLIKDYKPNTIKNSAILESLKADVGNVTGSVSGLSHRLQLYSDIPASNKVYVDKAIKAAASQEDSDPGSSYYPSLLTKKLQHQRIAAAASSSSRRDMRLPETLSIGDGNTPAIAITERQRPMSNVALGMALLSLPPLAFTKGAAQAKSSLFHPNNNSMTECQANSNLKSIISLKDDRSSNWDSCRRSPREALTTGEFQTIRETAQHFRRHGQRAGVVANPQNSILLGTAATATSELNQGAMSPLYDREEEMQAAISVVNYPEKYRELAVLQDQQDIRAEVYEGYRKDYDNHVKYVGSVMDAMSQGNFSTTIHDKNLLIPTHSHKVLQLMSRLRRETVPIMFVKHDEEGSDESGEETSESDEEEETKE